MPAINYQSWPINSSLLTATPAYLHEYATHDQHQSTQLWTTGTGNPIAANNFNSRSFTALIPRFITGYSHQEGHGRSVAPYQSISVRTDDVRGTADDLYVNVGYDLRFVQFYGGSSGNLRLGFQMSKWSQHFDSANVEGANPVVRIRAYDPSDDGEWIQFNGVLGDSGTLGTDWFSTTSPDAQVLTRDGVQYFPYRYSSIGYHVLSPTSIISLNNGDNFATFGSLGIAGNDTLAAAGLTPSDFPEDSPGYRLVISTNPARPELREGWYALYRKLANLPSLVFLFRLVDTIDMHHDDPQYRIDYASQYDDDREASDFEYDAQVPSIDYNIDDGETTWRPQLWITVGIDTTGGTRDFNDILPRESLFIATRSPQLSNASKPDIDIFLRRNSLFIDDFYPQFRVTAPVDIVLGPTSLFLQTLTFQITNTATLTDIVLEPNMLEMTDGLQLDYPYNRPPGSGGGFIPVM